MPLYQISQHVFLVVILLSSFSAHCSQTRLPDNIIPLAQNVQLTIAPTKPDFSGSTQLRLFANEGVTTAALHAKNIQIRSVYLDYQGVTYPLSASKENEFDIITLTLPIKVNGEFSLSLLFSGTVNNNKKGLYHYETDQSDYVFSQFQPMQARTAFPLLDEPALKIPFTFTVTTPNALEVLHNTSVIKKTVQPHYTRWEFAPTKPISPDIIALLIGKFDKVTIEELPIKSTFYALPGQAAQIKQAASLVAPLWHKLQQFFTVEFPYEKLDFAAVPELDAAGMENAGLITLNTDYVLFNQPMDSESLCDASILIAHEISHMWFGNLVTMAWWNDLWLNESFAEWIAAKVVNAHVNQALCAALPQKTALMDDVTQSPLQRPINSLSDVESFGQIVYDKGYAILNMVENLIGSDAFAAIINRYVTEYAGKSATSTDLIALFTQSYPETKGVFESFLTQPGFPLITFTVNDEGWLVSQRPFNAQEKRPLVWSVPLHLQIINNGQSEYRQILLNTQSQQLKDIPIDSVILADNDGKGYYRYQAPQRLLQLAYINRLSEIAQVAWLDNQQHLAKSGVITLQPLLEVQAKLLATDSISESLTLSLLSDIGWQFIEVLPASLWAPYQHYLADQLAKKLKLIPWSRLGDSPLDAAWLHFAGIYLGYPDVIQLAETRLPTLLAPNADTNISAFALLATLAMHGSDDTYSAMITALSELTGKQRQYLLSALGYVSTPERAKRYIALLLSDETINDTIDYRFQFPGFHPALRQTLLDEVMRNQEAIKERISEDELQWFVFNFSTACQRQFADDVQTAFSQWDDVEGIGPKLEEVTGQIKNCAATLESMLPQVQQWLDK